MYSPCLSRKSCYISLRVEQLYKFSCTDFSHISHLFTQLFISVWTYGYLFHTLGYNLILFYLSFSQTVLALAFGTPFSYWALCPFHILSQTNVCLFEAFFLLFGTMRFLYISYLISRISHFSKEPWFFLLNKWYLKPKSGYRKCSECHCFTFFETLFNVQLNKKQVVSYTFSIFNLL